MVFHEKHSRSIVKALTYRIVIMTADSIVVYALTHQVKAVAGFVVISNIYSTGIYFFHERAWNHVHWGKSHTIKHTSKPKKSNRPDNKWL